jgi:hypothetical protein
MLRFISFHSCFFLINYVRDLNFSYENVFVDLQESINFGERTKILT